MTQRPAVFLIAVLILAGVACSAPAVAYRETATHQAPELQPSRTETAPSLTARAGYTSTPTPPAFCSVANTAGQWLHLRAAPSVASGILEGLQPGQRLEVLNIGSEWHQVKTGQLVGYVYSQFCTIEGIKP